MPLWGWALFLGVLSILVQHVVSASARQIAVWIFQTDLRPAVHGIVFMWLLYSLAWYAALLLWVWLF